jgi:hypothetical protein
MAYFDYQIDMLISVPTKALSFSQAKGLCERMKEE